MASTLQENLHIFKSLSAVEMKGIENLRILHPAESYDLVQQCLVPDFKIRTCVTRYRY